ncbi:MAG: ABC-type transport system, periplasmic component [Candidatus Krumholzibacteriota bacterium]|nr:ABC-type transport system, periplasmic component [Candidatus Krumholzibacteriota bacterium]
MHTKRRTLELLAAGVALAAVALATVSCDSGKKDPAPAPGGTVVVGLLGDPKSLNPLVAASIESRNVIELLFLKLLEEQGDFVSFQPKLAKGWQFGADSLTVTFALRDDVAWSDGKPVTAHDVLYTWELQVDTLVAWPNRSVKERIAGVEVIDEYTVRFRFTGRYPYQLMDANDGVILPKHVLEKVPRAEIRDCAFGRNPVGNGPYRLSRWEPEQFVELERNPEYYERGLPRLDRVVFRIVPDMTALVTQLESGEIDCLESLSLEAAAEIRADHPEIRIYTYPSRQQLFIAWNLRKPLFSSPDVRRALAMAVNTEEMIQTLWGGMARVSNGPMHPVLWAHDPAIPAIPFDPGEAQALLAANGWADHDGDGVLDNGGMRLEFEMIANQGNRLRADVMTMIQEYLRRIGVRVVVRTFEWNTFVEKITTGDFASCVFGWKAATKADLTDLWRSTSAPPAGFNVPRYANAEVDSLIDLARNSLDVDEARRLWFRCQRIIFEDQPVLFLAVPYEVVGLHRRFCGVEPNAIGFFVNLPEWYEADVCP